MAQKGKNIAERKIRLQSVFRARQLDGFIFFNMTNIRYLSGFTGSEGALFIRSGQDTLFVDGRYTAQSALETKGIKIIECTDKIEAIIQAIQKHQLKKIGFENDCTTMDTYKKLSNRLPKGILTGVSDGLRMFRACKDDTEIAHIKQACHISSYAVHSILHQVKPGWTEKELALQLEIEARHNGADGIAFDTIVAAGEHSSLPHARPTDRKIKQGDFVVIDFGVRYKGYCSDETCTIAFGKLTDRQKNAYQTVKNAHDRALNAVADGISAADIDKEARSVFGKKDGGYFVHGTGHGVGLDIHEAPRLSAISGDILKQGMVFTIEPGLYIPGLWGIRIEDTVLLKKNGCEKLTKMDKELIMI